MKTDFAMDAPKLRSVRRASRLPGAEVTLLPVAPAFESILPQPGLRKGSTVATAGLGATSLALGLAAEASRRGWVAVCGLPHLGLLAAHELGVVLDRVAVVTEAAPDVAAALVDAFDIVLLQPDALRAAHLRKLDARAKERGCVLISVGPRPDADLRLTGHHAAWDGLGDGHGHLRTRTLTVEVHGRRAASIGRRFLLRVPDPEHGVALVGTERMAVAR